jgi:hypothetical protein
MGGVRRPGVHGYVDEKAVVGFLNTAFYVSPRPTRSGLQKDWTDSTNPCDPRSHASALTDGVAGRAFTPNFFFDLLNLRYTFSSKLIISLFIDSG